MSEEAAVKKQAARYLRKRFPQRNDSMVMLQLFSISAVANTGSPALIINSQRCWVDVFPVTHWCQAIIRWPEMELTAVTATISELVVSCEKRESLEAYGVQAHT